MRNRSMTIWVMVIGLCLSNSPVVLAACPSADLTGDCRVDLADFAIMASQWLGEGVPENPNNLIWVYINAPGFNGEMSKYETTNAQYCQFLNAALASGDITRSDYRVRGAIGSNPGADFVGEIYFDAYPLDFYSQITYSDGVFSVRNRDGYDMSNHPVVTVSWYGATAFCNYYGYRLPTEWEWQAVANYDGSYTYGCGTMIDQSKANYYSYDDDHYANPLGLTLWPYTSPVNYYFSYGYGMNDMAGNVWEWTSSIYSGSYHIVRGGSWYDFEEDCDVSRQHRFSTSETLSTVGFRVCR